MKDTLDDLPEQKYNLAITLKVLSCKHDICQSKDPTSKLSYQTQIHVCNEQLFNSFSLFFI